MSEKIRSVIGKVVSDRMDKTAAVVVTRQLRHPLYGKYIRRSTKVLVHDMDNRASVGDQVCIRECRRKSKNKAWELVEVLGSEIMADDILSEDALPEAAAIAETAPEETVSEPEETGSEESAPEDTDSEEKDS